MLAQNLSDNLQCHCLLLRTRNIGNRSGNATSRTSEQNIQQNEKLFQNGSSLCTGAAASRSHFPEKLEHCLFWKYLFLIFRKIGNLQALEEGEKQQRLERAEHCSTQPECYSEYSSELISDECMLCIKRVIIKQEVRRWGVKHPCEHSLVVTSSLDLMKWCAVSKEYFIGSYSFENESITGESCRNMVVPYAFLLFK